jgi:hypothetical protein
MKNDELLITLPMEQMCDIMKFIYDKDHDTFDSINNNFWHSGNLRTMFILFEVWSVKRRCDRSYNKSLFEFIKDGIEEHGDIDKMTDKLLDREGLEERVKIDVQRQKKDMNL